MKKNYIKIFFISFFIFLICPFNAKADNGYVIKNYNVDIKVNENNVLNIKETIDVNFILESHGIYEYIALVNNFNRDDFDTKTKAKVSNLKINEKYTTSKSDGILKLTIGDPDKTIIGEKQYIIEYDYDYGDDNIEKYDELYHNIISNKWTTSIQNVNFKIQMPKEFDTSLINFTVGYYGSTYYEDVIYNIDGNTIEGTINKNLSGNALNQSEGLTVRIELPEGYFKGERKVFDPTFLIIHGEIILTSLLIIFGIIIFKKYSYYKKDLLVVEYTVPDNLTPAEIGYLYDGKTKNEQIVSLITYLANKGYLKIIDEGKKNFSFQKLKDISPKEPQYVKTTFNGLFANANKDGIVKKSSLVDKFYKTLRIFYKTA